ncbi:unnamed protein product [Lepeophtheirus salmonis]|uniref:(salmon louse) hypothetical protein n=1 Tax=Lepeophtheirus salmonis TaxID=72036 RepID=A0A7R8CM31_LEPSM|nr:unnamed protein product [Lepeophtheirus salmonis]CAF2859379.1 unnamed protein product [Lepeophtheirus salmonis]
MDFFEIPSEKTGNISHLFVVLLHFLEEEWNEFELYGNSKSSDSCKTLLGGRREREKKKKKSSQLHRNIKSDDCSCSQFQIIPNVFYMPHTPKFQCSGLLSSSAMSSCSSPEIANTVKQQMKPFSRSLSIPTEGTHVLACL